MLIAIVVDAVTAPTKHPGLAGAKLLVVEIDRSGELLLAVDAVGAGTGDRVIVSTGSHAVSLVRPDAPVDCVIVGILRPGYTLPARTGETGQSSFFRTPVQ